MDIHIFDSQKDLLIDQLQVTALIKEILAVENEVCNEVAVHFVSEARICQLHAEFFDDPSPTDCISFPMDDSSEELGYRMLGEVFVCPKVALEYAKTHNQDPYEETALYITHGILHLLGYDDQDEVEEPLMRAAEAKLMQHLKHKKMCFSCSTFSNFGGSSH